MDIKFDLDLTQEQKLIMTQDMQLSLKLLQMSSLELKEQVEKEAEENLVLELSYNEDDEKNSNTRIDYTKMAKYLEFDSYSHGAYEKNNEDEISPFNFVSEKKSLKQYLFEQIIDIGVKGYLKQLCQYLIESLDSRGYLDEGIEQISEKLKIDISLAEKALQVLQSLEPAGIGARDVKECLRLQLKKRGYQDKNIYDIIENHLENLGENKYSIIAKKLGIELIKAQEYGDIIKSLNPKPSSGFYTGEQPPYIVPEAYIRKIGEEYHIIMNDTLLPRIQISEGYKEIIREDKDSEAAIYIREKINSAIFLVKSIEHRKSTIYKVLQEILNLQREYFDKGENYLKPMTLKDIAERIKMNESTVSRAVKDKYINTSRGTVKIKNLFTVKLSSSDNNEEISSSIIKNEIKELIDKENKLKPLSDQDICDLLNKNGRNISRRTVAKYREEMSIKSSSKRKRF